MFDGLLDSRRPENTSPDTPTLSLICHPMQVIPRSPPSLALRSLVLHVGPGPPAGPADQRQPRPTAQEDAVCLSAWREDGRGVWEAVAVPLLRQQR